LSTYVYKPLFRIARGKIPEIEIHGFTLIYQHDKRLFGNDKEANSKIVSRSLLKPWQLLAANVPIEKDHRWLIAAASHSGELEHLKTVHALANEHQINIDDLLCPEAYPMDKDLKAIQKSDGLPPARTFHNCSGKHLGYLWSCKNNHHDPLTYLNPDHPINVSLKNKIENITKNKITFVTDGCGLQSVILSAKDMIKLYQSLANEDTPASKALIEHWIEYPRLVSGRRRLDADIVDDLKGDWISKEGADGLIMLQSPKSERGLSILCKLSSGMSHKYWAMGIWSALKSLNSEEPELKRLQHYLGLKVQQFLEPYQEFQIITP